MGFFDVIKTLLSSGEISFEKQMHLNTAQNLLTDERRNYIGEWRGAKTNLLIKADGTVDYRRAQTIGGATHTDTISGPINGFDGASFTVGVLGQNTRFQVDRSPTNETMTVNGERLERI